MNNNKNTRDKDNRRPNRLMVLRQFWAFIKKEFFHVFRDRKTLLIMFALPAVQILLFGFALTNELKNADLMLVNSNSSPASLSISNKIANSAFFTLVSSEATTKNVETYFKTGKCRVAVVFPDNFGSESSDNPQVQIIVDGTDPNTAKTIVNYLNAIMGEYQLSNDKAQINIPLKIDVETTMLYNPSLKGSMMFIPGVIAMVMMIISTTLTAVSVVREKEFGSFEVLLVSPLKPILVLISKALPYLVLSVFNLILILVMSRYIFEVPIRGDIFLLFGESMLFILTCLAIGLVFSNITESQAVAMLLSMMGMLLPMLLFTGVIFPLDNMPQFYQWISYIIPARWYYTIAKDIMLKGSGIVSLWHETLVLVGMTIFLTSVSMLKFKKRLE